MATIDSSTIELDVHKVFTDINSKIELDVPNIGFSATAFMVSDTFTIQAAAQYEAEYRIGAGDTANRAVKMLSSMIAGKQSKLEVLKSSVMSWIDTQRPVFSLEMIFFSTKRNQDPRINGVQLIGGVLPYSNSLLMIDAPWQYNVGNMFSGNEVALDASGTMAVKIGQWFYARGQVLTDAQMDLSKETTVDGYPLYSQVTIQFTPAVMPTRSDFFKYFPKMSLT